MCFPEETLTGARQLTSRAYLTFVAIARDGSRVLVPPLIVETDEERRVCEEAHRAAGAAVETEDGSDRRPRVYDAALSRSTLFSRSIPTRYWLRNLWPTMPPS